MIRVLIADDNKNLRFHIRKILERVSEIQVVAEAENGVEALKQIETTKVDLILLDLEMPLMGGIEVLQELKKIRSKIKVVILSGYTDRELINGTIDLGAKGYIFKEEAPLYLIPAIQGVYKDFPVWLSKQAASIYYTS